MSATSINSWIGVVASLSGLIVGLVTALWVYTKFVLERGLLPPVQFWLGCKAFGLQGGKTPLEIDIHLKNLGTATLIATNIRIDIRYLTDSDPIEPSLTEKPAALFGQLRFSRSLKAEMVEQSGLEVAPEPKRKKLRDGDPPDTAKEHRGLSIIGHDTFVQAKVDQTYTFVTAVPAGTRYVLVWSTFDYAQRPKPLQNTVLWISRRLGLIQFTLAHATEGHTTQQVYELKDGTIVSAQSAITDQVTSAN